MNNMAKIALVSASVLTMGALTACQSNPGPKDKQDGRPMMHHGHHEKMSPEQREQFKQMRAERHEFKNKLNLHVIIKLRVLRFKLKLVIKQLMVLVQSISVLTVVQ